jgi:peptidyl-prolyl cis-trans isomerase SurA
VAAVMAGWLVLPAVGQVLRNGVAAIANEHIVTFHDVERASAQAVEGLYRIYRRDPAVFDQKRLEAMSDALEQLLERQLILDDFKAAGGALPENVIDDEIKDRIRARFGDRATFTKSLQAEGITYEAYRQRVREEIVTAFMDRRNVREAILISPAKIERYYQTNQARFTLGDQILLRTIVLTNVGENGPEAVLRQAQDILKKVDEGASFAEMATTYSDGTQRKDGGSWGWIGETKLRKGLSDVAFALPPGARSGVLGFAVEPEGDYWIYQYDGAGKISRARHYASRDTLIEEKTLDANDPAGLPAPPREFYLLQVDEKKVAHVRPLAELRDEIEKELLIQERSRLRKKWVERLKSKSFVRYF